jgi:hypothetical protein
MTILITGSASGIGICLISKKHNLDEVFNDPSWHKLFDTFDSRGKAWIECEQKCHTSIVDENYAVGWLTN